MSVSHCTILSFIPGFLSLHTISLEDRSQDRGWEVCEEMTPSQEAGQRSSLNQEIPTAVVGSPFFMESDPHFSQLPKSDFLILKMGWDIDGVGKG